MGKIIRLTESDLTRLVNRVIKEQSKDNWMKNTEVFLIRKGFKLRQGNDTISSLVRGDKTIESFNGNNGDILKLTNNGFPNKEVISISSPGWDVTSFSDGSEMFNVQYFKPDKNGKLKVIKTDKINGTLMGQKILDFIK